MKHLFYLILIVCPLLLVTSCVSKAKYEKSQDAIDSLQTVIEKGRPFDFSKLDSVLSNNAEDLADVRFNLDLNYDGYQAVHLSSDSSAIPFMLVCKIQSSRSANGRKIDDLELAVRSTNQKPATYFKITGSPQLIKWDSIKNGTTYTHKLMADLDLNTSRSSMEPTKVSMSGFQEILRDVDNLVEVEINPKKLIESIKKANKGNILFSEEELADFDKFCCRGVICSLRLLQK